MLTSVVNPDTGITEVVQDTSPQLGGDLDVNGNSIISASDGDIPITPNGTGSVILDGQNWPQADGAGTGQVITTDGAGQLSWANRVTTPTDIAFDADNFTATGGTWTVEEADQIALWYSILRVDLIVFSFRIGLTTIASAPSRLHIALPLTYVITTGQSCDGPYYLIDGDTSGQIGHYTAFAGDAFLSFRTMTNIDFTNGTNTATVTGQAILAVTTP